VRIRVTPTGLEPVDNLQITATVRPWPDGEVTGTGSVEARSQPLEDPLGGEHFFLDVPMPHFRPWTPETCNLYTAEITVRRADQVLLPLRAYPSLA
jgi:hypothetical protein